MNTMVMPLGIDFFEKLRKDAGYGHAGKFF